MRERRYLTFEMNNPRHVKALALFDGHSKKQRSNYIVDCMLSMQEPIDTAEIIRETITKLFQGQMFSAMPKKQEVIETKADDLPESFLTFFDNF